MFEGNVPVVVLPSFIQPMTTWLAVRPDCGRKFWKIGFHTALFASANMVALALGCAPGTNVTAGLLVGSALPSVINVRNTSKVSDMPIERMPILPFTGSGLPF